MFNEQNKKNLKFFFIKKELPLCDYQIKILIYNKIIKSNNTAICKEIIIYCSTVLMIIYIIHVFAVGEFVHWNLYRSLHLGRWRLSTLPFPIRIIQGKNKAIIFVINNIWNKNRNYVVRVLPFPTWFY